MPNFRQILSLNLANILLQDIDKKNQIVYNIDK